MFTRAANVYGPGQQLYRIIPRTMLSMRTGLPLDLHGGGVSKRCFIHIDDVVEATLMLSMKAEPGSTWHLSSNEAFTIKELVRIKKQNPSIEHKVAFLKAAQNWKKV